MTRPQDDPPTNWSPLQPLLDVGGGVYVYLPESVKDGDRGNEVIVYHWHTPKDDEPRWQAAYLGLHTIVSTKPLTIEASLACDEGCPNHGWITNGSWRNA